MAGGDAAIASPLRPLGTQSNGYDLRACLGIQHSLSLFPRILISEIFRRRCVMLCVLQCWIVIHGLDGLGIFVIELRRCVFGFDCLRNVVVVVSQLQTIESSCFAYLIAAEHVLDRGKDFGNVLSLMILNIFILLIALLTVLAIILNDLDDLFNNILTFL